jgi:hypothetical protein
MHEVGTEFLAGQGRHLDAGDEDSAGPIRNCGSRETGLNTATSAVHHGMAILLYIIIFYLFLHVQL